MRLHNKISLLEYLYSAVTNYFYVIIVIVSLLHCSVIWQHEWSLVNCVHVGFASASLQVS